MGRSPLATNTMSFIPKSYASAAAGGNDKPYFSCNKVEPGGQVKFALLDDQPLCYWELWATDGEKNKPFRFEDEPNPSDIEAELGPNFERRIDKKTGDVEPTKFMMSVPIYNYVKERVETFSFYQKTVMAEFDQISQLEEYKDLKAIDFVLTRTKENCVGMYGLRPVPRMEGHSEKVKEAWTAALDNGYDISRMLTGGQPHVKA